ncbi:Actin-related protein [Drosera capensis]
MAMLLKKVLELRSSTRNLGRDHHHHDQESCWDDDPPPSNRGVVVMPAAAAAGSSTGTFDRIPDEILYVIVKMLGPKEAARISAVCRTWRSLVSNNRLWIHFLQIQSLHPYHHHHRGSSSDPCRAWDSIFFAETRLRSGYPLQLYYSQAPQLSFMRIYGQRALVPGSVIIDGGSGYCKFGWSKYNAPSGRSATFCEFGNIETPLYSRLSLFYTTIYSKMQVKPPNQPLVVSTPICHYDDTESAKASRKQLGEAIHSVLFDLNVPAVCAINQATLALYAARRTSGIVVNIGFQHTSVVPILHGEVLSKVGVESVGMGALKLTEFLRQQLQQKNIHFDSLYTVWELKEASLHWLKNAFKQERYCFNHEWPERAMGLHQAVALCMDHCHDAELMYDDSWYKTVVLSGGTACLPGLAERLEKELHEMLPSAMATGIRVIPPPYGSDSAWFGAKIISNLSTFPGAWCVTKKQFKHKLKRDLMVSRTAALQINQNKEKGNQVQEDHQDLDQSATSKSKAEPGKPTIQQS